MFIFVQDAQFKKIGNKVVNEEKQEIKVDHSQETVSGAENVSGNNGDDSLSNSELRKMMEELKVIDGEKNQFFEDYSDRLAMLVIIFS